MPRSTIESTVEQPRPRSARGEGDQLRTDLLDAAADLIAEHGSVDGISLRAIARRTGVSPTAVYRHFSDHTELLQTAVRHCWDNFLRVLEHACSGDGDAFDAFERCGVGYADFALQYPGQYRVMFSHHIEIEAETSIVANSTFLILVDLVQQMLLALDDGRSTHIVAVQVHTWIHGIVGLSSAHPDVEWPPIHDQLLGLGEALGLVRPS
ncbi:MAG: TetR/AcrR family transcriptional regulator [Ilumatobacter sp.]|uniref:TetR/AcrR family transcriptional regulator n=1 Tax=Ilumatobacter sp. TaxID=1967498 RepID=UPI0032974563